jgi:hypothetical protein
LIDGFVERGKITAASIYKQFGTDVGILIRGEAQWQYQNQFHQGDVARGF